MPGDGDGDTDAAATLGWLLDASHELPPDDVPRLVADAAARLGASDTRIYLADVDQRHLVPLSRSEDDQADALDIDSTLAGRAFQTSLPASTQDEEWTWMPIRNGTDRLGVLRLSFATFDDVAAASARHLASLAADLVIAKSQYGDLFQQVRRRRPLGLAAELQWQLLPPLTFATPRITVAGILEPAYHVAGDAFDYALNADTLSAAVFDAVGHSLDSSVMTAVAVGAYRYARRRGLDLAATAIEIDKALDSQFGTLAFVTAALVEVDVTSGAVRWLNAGHPRPLLLRDGSVVRTLACAPRPPLGIPHADAEIGTEQLEPGDALLVFTDGIVEARSATGKGFGFTRLADFFERAAASDLEPAETMRRLVHAVVDHNGGQLQDDATCVLVGWPAG